LYDKSKLVNVCRKKILDTLLIDDNELDVNINSLRQGKMSCISSGNFEIWLKERSRYLNDSQTEKHGNSRISAWLMVKLTRELEISLHRKLAIPEKFKVLIFDLSALIKS
jgi:hypothetical protein